MAQFFNPKDEFTCFAYYFSSFKHFIRFSDVNKHLIS